MEKNRKTWGQRLSSLYLWLILLFVYLPIIYVVVFSFNESKSQTNFTGFSLRWYQSMLEDSTMLESIKYTVEVAVIATLALCSAPSRPSAFPNRGRCCGASCWRSTICR